MVKRFVRQLPVDKRDVGAVAIMRGPLVFDRAFRELSRRGGAESARLPGSRRTRPAPASAERESQREVRQRDPAASPGTFSPRASCLGLWSCGARGVGSYRGSSASFGGSGRRGRLARLLAPASVGSSGPGRAGPDRRRGGGVAIERVVQGAFVLPVGVRIGSRPGGLVWAAGQRGATLVSIAHDVARRSVVGRCETVCAILGLLIIQRLQFSLGMPSPGCCGLSGGARGSGGQAARATWGIGSRRKSSGSSEIPIEARRSFMVHEVDRRAERLGCCRSACWRAFLSGVLISVSLVVAVVECSNPEGSKGTDPMTLLALGGFVFLVSASVVRIVEYAFPPG